MAENNGINNNDFRFEVRKIKLNKDDYKDNKKEKFLFEHLSEGFSFFSKLDKEKGTGGVITKGDINIFLSSAEVQKKKITEEDVINFLNKVRDLNPTEKEKVYSQLNITDENNNDVITNEMYSFFDKKTSHSYDLKFSLTDMDGNVKKGFEIFDLNSDGKIDKVEEGYFDSNSEGTTGYNQLKTFLTSLDKAGSTDGKADGVITAEDRLKAYNNVFVDKLKELDIKNEAGKSVITPEILALFENGESEVKFDDLTSADGSLKAGFELFDINGDGKIDDIEKSYFSSGGHAISDDTSKFSAKSLVGALEAYDKFGISQNGNDRADALIKSRDSENLYNVISSAHYLVDAMKDSEEFPEDIRKMYNDALKEVRIGEYVTYCATGVCDGDYVGINYHGRDKFEINSILLHELTHYLLTNKTGMGKNTYLMQEVETFFMEYKLYNLESKLEKDNPEFQKARRKTNTLLPSSGYSSVISEIKRNNPNISEKELALQAFLKTKYDSYDSRYEGEGYSSYQLSELVRNSDKYVMLK